MKFTPLLTLLADNRPHSITDLCQKFNLTPESFIEKIQTLQQYGINCHQPTVKTVQLIDKLELLNRTDLLSYLTQLYPFPIQLALFEVIDSTNDYALKQETTLPLICLAEYQTAGRGRQGRRWFSPYASGLCLSIKYHYSYSKLNYTLTGLNIALAITVAKVLTQIGINDIGIKWPNDIMWQQQKLAGLLLETRYQPKQGWHIVIGIGMNVHLPQHINFDHLDQPWTDLTTILGYQPQRNQLIAMLSTACLQTLNQYFQQGLSPFLIDWQRFDVLYGQYVTRTTPQGILDGIAQGIDEEGALILQQAHQRIRCFYH